MFRWSETINFQVHGAGNEVGDELARKETTEVLRALETGWWGLYWKTLPCLR